MDIIQELESLHWEATRLAGQFDNHGWSRQITRYDAEFVGVMSKKLQEFSNRLYNLEGLIRDFVKTNK